MPLSICHKRGLKQPWVPGPFMAERGKWSNTPQNISATYYYHDTMIGPVKGDQGSGPGAKQREDEDEEGLGEGAKGGACI